MPIYTDAQIKPLQSDFQTSDLYEAPQAAPTVGQTFAAAFDKNNTIGSALAQQDRGTDGFINPDYDVIDKLKDTAYQYRANDFLDINNDQDLQKRMSQIDMEDKNNQILNNSGWTGTVANLSSGLLDPINLIPGLGLGAKIAKAAAAGDILGTLGYGAAAGASQGVVSSAAAEGLLQGSQRTRSFEESAYTVAASAALGGILGGGISHIASRGVMKVPEDIMSSTARSADGTVDVKVDPNLGPDSAGAAKVSVESFSATGVPNWVLQAPTLGGITKDALTAPAIRGIVSDSPFLRRMTNELFETNIRVDGLKSPAIESLLKADRVDNLNFNKVANDQYLSYLEIKDGSFNATRGAIAAKRSGKLSKADFDDAVGKAMRRGDQSDIPQVATVAKHLREKFDVLNKRMQELGILPEDLKLHGDTASYLSRVYSTDKITNNRALFEQRLTDHLVNRHGVAESEAKEIARDSTNKIVGINDKDTSISEDFITPQLDSGVSFTKDRTLDIPDLDIEDFLVSDSNRIGQRYISDANRMIRTKEFLDRNGFESFQDMRRELKSEFDSALARDPNNAELTKSYKKNSELMNDFIAMNNNKFLKRTKADDFLRSLRALQYLNMMGYMVVSSITDVAMPILKHGLGATAMDGWITGLRNFGSAGKLLNNDLRDLGVGIELELNNTVRMFSDVSENVEPTRINNFVGRVSDTFSKANLSTYWNNTHKRLAGRVAESRIFRASANFSKLEKGDLAYLNELGINENMAKRITDQYKQFGADYQGGHIVNITAWSDKGAQDTFKAAIQKEVDSTIITPGKGDAPLVSQKYEMAKNLLQFKGFFNAMTSKAVLPALQRRDSNALQGVLALLGLGGLQYVVRTKAAGREPNYAPEKILLETINRSGLLGMLGDPIMGLAFNSGRYMNGSVTNAVLGATFSSVETGAKAGSAALQGDYAKAWEQGQKLLPFQNLFYLRMLLDKGKPKPGV